MNAKQLKARTAQIDEAIINEDISTENRLRDELFNDLFSEFALSEFASDRDGLETQRRELLLNVERIEDLREVVDSQQLDDVRRGVFKQIKRIKLVLQHI